MKKFFTLALLVSLLVARPVWASIAHVASLGTALATTSGNTLVITTAATLEVANIATVSVAMDNVGTTNADHSEISGVADSAGNTYSKLCEFTNGNGTAAAGATASLWFTKATSELASGGTITITFANSIVARVARANEFTVTSGNTLTQSSACQTEAQDAGTEPGALVFSGLSNIERLYLRVIGQESDSGVAITPTTNFTTIGAVVRAEVGSTATSMRVMGEFRVVTATGETSDPGATTSDNVGVFVALHETAVAGPARRPQAPVIF